MPETVVIALCPEMPPTTLTDCADSVAAPTILRADDELFELSYRLQPLSMTLVLPSSVSAPLAVVSSARTQPVPLPLASPTARALMVPDSELMMREKYAVLVPVMITSIAPEFVV